MKYICSYKIFFVLATFISTAQISAQTYTRFYSDNYVIAKIEAQGWKSTTGRYCEHLFLRLKSSEAVQVSGYLRIRFTEKYSGNEFFKESYFTTSVYGGYPVKVNDYWNPDYKVGDYETVGFYIDSVKPLNSSTNGNSNQAMSSSSNTEQQLYVVLSNATVYVIDALGNFVVYYTPDRSAYYSYNQGDILAIYGTVYKNGITYGKLSNNTYVVMSDLKKY